MELIDTLFVGQNRIYLETVGSTNSFALNLLKEQAIPEGTLVYTFNQEMGRGQRENKWLTEPGKNLAFSFVFFPHFLSIQKQFALTMMCSLSAHDFIKAILGDSTDVKIKWPNDIYVKDKKIAGTLIENSLNAGHFVSSVCGFGININQVEFSSLLPNPISLKKLTNKEYDLEMCIRLFVSHLEKNYLLLRSGKHEKLKKQYLQHLYKRGVWANYRSKGHLFSGCVNGVDDSGKLMLENKSGELISFNFREVEFLQ